MFQKEGNIIRHPKDLRQDNEDKKKIFPKGWIISIVTLLILIILAVGIYLIIHFTSRIASTTNIVNPSIRWNTTGITVAGVGGSPGNNSSQLNTPADVSVDFSNTLYIADYGNNRIQKWLSGASNGITVAGQASGISGSNATDLQHPAGILVDLTGNIYIADTNNHRIQFWAKGALSGVTIAGTAVHNIVRWILGDNSWTQVAGISGIQGNSSSLLNLPMGVTFDPMGNMIHFALLDCQYRRRFRSRTSAMSIVLILFCVLMNAVNGQNCSVYNPCGRNGYCTYEDEEPICECKFWWIGTFCNELTNSGKQVIILGSLLGVLIITFHSLNIFHLYRQRKRQPKKATKK
ncbi:unnamed protein product [Rotaria magnacalcarata]|nr:unnamed protein product [Rotaria magnacalcarata]